MEAGSSVISGIETLFFAACTSLGIADNKNVLYPFHWLAGQAKPTYSQLTSYFQIDFPKSNQVPLWPRSWAWMCLLQRKTLNIDAEL